jgi:hypothetical protein
MAERIVITLAPVEGERAVVRYDPAAMPEQTGEERPLSK